MEAGGSKVGCHRRSTNAHLSLTKGCFFFFFFKLRFSCAIKFAMCGAYTQIFRLGAKSTSQTLKRAVNPRVGF